MTVVIGIDPHKQTHQAVAVDDREDELSRLEVRATRTQVDRLVRWAAPFEKRQFRERLGRGRSSCVSRVRRCRASSLCRRAHRGIPIDAWASMTSVARRYSSANHPSPRCK